jgi:hypothetical protein
MSRTDFKQRFQIQTAFAILGGRARTASARLSPAQRQASWLGRAALGVLLVSSLFNTNRFGRPRRTGDGAAVESESCASYDAVQWAAAPVGTGGPHGGTASPSPRLISLLVPLTTAHGVVRLADENDGH